MFQAGFCLYIIKCCHSMNGPLISQYKTIDQWKRCMYWRNRQCFWQQWYSFLLGAKLVKRDLRDNGKQEFEQEKHEQLTCCVCERWTGKTVNLLIRDSLGTKAPSANVEQMGIKITPERSTLSYIDFSSNPTALQHLTTPPALPPIFSSHLLWPSFASS